MELDRSDDFKEYNADSLSLQLSGLTTSDVSIESLPTEVSESFDFLWN